MQKGRFKVKQPVPTWDPIIRSRNSHLIHLGDRGNSNPDRLYKWATRCGRELGDCDISVFRYAVGFEPEMLLDERWKEYISFNPRRRHKDPVLCARCGTPEQFRDAFVEMKDHHELSKAYLDHWHEREQELYDQLILQRNEDLSIVFKALQKSGNLRLSVKLDETDNHSKLVVAIDGRSYSVNNEVSINDTVKEQLEREKRVAEEE